MTFLADTFSDLANDPRWPLDATDRLNHGTMVGLLAREKLKQARLAIMVVREILHLATVEEPIPDGLRQLGISPDHYANVKKRVEEANG